MIDWYYDRLPGSEFSDSLHGLRERGQVVAATALNGATPNSALRIVTERFPNLRLKDSSPVPEGILLRGTPGLPVILAS
ncbi:MAG: hypothetical protein V7744_05370 [Pseudomonadales bacterium]